MPNKLKDLKITSTDLVNQGANPDAHIQLFKRKDDIGDGAETDTLIKKIVDGITESISKIFKKSNDAVEKDARTFDQEIERERKYAISNQLWDFTSALRDSYCSIIWDEELSDDGKLGLMYKSLDEFAETLRNAIPVWAAGNTVEKSGDNIAKSATETAAFDALIAKYLPAPGGGGNDIKPSAMDKPIEKSESEPGKDNFESNITKTEEADSMKIDKSKMTPKEQATLAEFEKKYGIAEQEGGVAKETTVAPAELHPEVKKALEENKALTARIEEMQKSLEIKDLTAIAKKYEIIGKKADELAPKLYELKKAGGTAYADFVGLLDEQVTLVEKGGTFAEIGSNASGTAGTGNELNLKAAEIRKSNPNMSAAEAFAKAYDENPELAAQYEKDYRRRA